MFFHYSFEGGKMAFVLYLRLISTSAQLPKLIATKCINITISRNANSVPQACSNTLYPYAQQCRYTNWAQLIICTPLSTLAKNNGISKLMLVLISWRTTMCNSEISHKKIGEKHFKWSKVDYPSLDEPHLQHLQCFILHLFLLYLHCDPEEVNSNQCQSRIKRIDILNKQLMEKFTAGTNIV